MLGFVYFILASFVGYRLLKRLIPFIFNLSSENTVYQKRIGLQSWVVALPASVVIGTLFITWLTYFAAYAFKGTDNPLLYGNIISFSVFIVAAIILVVLDKECFKNAFMKIKPNSVPRFLRTNICVLIYLAFIILFVGYFMNHSFGVGDGNLKIGYSVYSDFGPHLSMIRSFSLGNNFPTEYPHYADGNIRYHFMFQFLAGNLEFLGLRIDWAFNLLSILSMVAFLTLLYGLAVILTGKNLVGFLTGIFFCFRSSASVFLYLFDAENPVEAIKKIFTSSEFFSYTPYESWGLWSFKDYVNQRHFAFSMAIMILAIIVVYPLFMKMIVSLREVRRKAPVLDKEGVDKDATDTVDTVDASSEDNEANIANTVDVANELNAVEGEPVKQDSKVLRWFREFAFNKDAWLPESWVRAITLGAILGAMSFWHGSILISALLVLCIMAIMSKHRLEYLVMAVMAVGFSVAQSSFFMGAGNSPVSFKFVFGFIAESKTLLGVGKYYLLLCGILPIVLIIAAIVTPKGGRWLMLSFLAPLVFATTVTLVEDISINHKYVAVSVMLLNIFAANLVYQYISTKGLVPKLAAGILVVALTLTGVANNIALNNMDMNHIQIQMENEIKNWVVNNTKTDDMFLTDDVVINQILLSGRRIFNGYGYFAGSAGYDVRAREDIVNRIYGGNNPEEVRELAKGNNIKYVVVDNAVRYGDNSYVLNEEVLKQSFKFVKHFDYDDTDIYIVE